MPHEVHYIEGLSIASEYILQPMAIIKGDGKVIFLNKTAEKILSCTAAELSESEIKHLVYDQDLFAWKRGIFELQTGKSDVWMCIRMHAINDTWLGPAIHWHVRSIQRGKQFYYVATGHVVPHLHAILSRKGIPTHTIKLNFEEYLASNDLLAVIQPNGRLLHLHMGSELKQVSGVPSIWNLLPTDAHEAIKLRLEQEISTGLSDRFPMEWRLAGEVFDTSTRIYPFREGNHVIAWALWAQIQEANPAREMKRLQALVEETHQELAQFGVALSHDIRAPLRAILAFTENVLQENQAQLNTHSVESLQNVMESTHRMHHILSAAARYAKISATIPKREEVDMQMVIKDSYEKLKLEFSDRIIQLDIVEVPPVQADLKLLVEVVKLLMRNAIKFSEHEIVTQIEVGGFPEAGGYTYFIRDNGIGIEDRFHERIFSLFQKLHPVETYSGLGVGLATARRIIALHGGRIWVQSTLGAGSTFYFYLPFQDV
ncbi:MAG: ATP-binding protein [Bacteroidota bacterium]